MCDFELYDIGMEIGVKKKMQIKIMAVSMRFCLFFNHESIVSVVSLNG